MFNSVIFDVDGTLLDASEGIKKSVLFALDKFNLKLPPHHSINEFIGPPIQNSCKNIFKLNEEAAQKFADCFRKKYAAGDVFLAEPYIHIYELLEFLKSINTKLGVATYKREDYAVDLMKHFRFDKYFDAIHGADNNNKLTKKDLINKCIYDLNTRPEETIFIGDSASDGIAAAEAGCQFIAVTYGFGFKNSNDTARFNPLLTVNNIDEIIKFFKLIQ